MKTILVHAALALLLISPPLCGADREDDAGTTVQCGKDTVVLFGAYAGGQSPDGRYSLGWTIRPTSRDVKPVDWSQLNRKDIGFYDVYKWNDWSNSSEAPYAMIDGVVDRMTKTFTEFPTDYTSNTYGNHGWQMHAEWLDSNYAVVIINARFWTADVFLLSLGKSGIAVKNLVEDGDRLVRRMAEEKRPLASGMGIMYDHAETSEHDEVLTISFSAGKPKGSFEDINGHLIVTLPDGKPVKVVSQDEADTPFTGKLGEADQQLNKTYSALRTKLGKASLKKLKSEQSDWIKQRDELASEETREKVPFWGENSDIDQYREVRNAKDLELTNQRIAVLRKRLDALDREKTESP